jgi:hypothetical protein
MENLNNPEKNTNDLIVRLDENIEKQNEQKEKIEVNKTFNTNHSLFNTKTT